VRGLLGRLRRLERLAAAIPPTDPLEDVPDEVMARAVRVLETRANAAPRQPGDPYWHKPEPPATAEDEAWYDAEFAPFVPRYARFVDAVERWRFNTGPRPHRGSDRYPAFIAAIAGKQLPRIRIPPDLARRAAA
jgi:hypothetical protein